MNINVVVFLTQDWFPFLQIYYAAMRDQKDIVYIHIPYLCIRSIVLLEGNTPDPGPNQDRGLC